MDNATKKAIMMGWIVQLCALEDDGSLLDLIYKLLATNSPGNTHDEEK